MGKKPNASQASAKAAKKSKVAQKVERKEIKKASKTKSFEGQSVCGINKGKGKSSKKKRAGDSDTDGEDLEGILERVGYHRGHLSFCDIYVGCYTSCKKNGRRHIQLLKNLSKVHQADEQMPH